MLVDASIREMTVPEEMPQWFDPSFEPTPGWTLPPPPPAAHDPQMWNRIRNELAAHGFQFGLQRMSDITKSRWKRYTDEELQQRYPKSQEAAE
jgi:hypothetical protein